MTTPPDRVPVTQAVIEAYLVDAMATCIAIQRDLMRDPTAEVAERNDMTVDRLIEALAWYRKIEPKYRITALAAAAQAKATEIRHAPLAPASETVYEPGDGRTGREDAERRDPTRPKRPCARCRRRFHPTNRRRILCNACFHLGEGTSGQRMESQAAADEGETGYRTPWTTPDIPF